MRHDCIGSDTAYQANDFRYGVCVEYPAATQAIANKLRVELQKYEEVEYLNIASALDPRFKLMFISQSWRKRLEQILLNGDDAPITTIFSAPSSSADPFQKYYQVEYQDLKKVPTAATMSLTHERVTVTAELDQFFGTCRNVG
ncbi:unnamed protein product [Nippostrongylus brasiliensis]|uniref:EKC/KEOPS complex subunit cgi121 n=1 Tax=Nippostrongylus brasiliensis TaxID=27835 RepID=A0A0N4XWQ8_NIPBR|nr:unnamed protein product [Nippostrongylus brasiliensis]